MKKRILLLNPPYPQPIIRDNYCCFTAKSGYQWAPTDLLYISGILNGDRRFTVSVIDAPGERVSEGATQARIMHIDPDIICCLTGTVSFEKDMAFIKRIKDRSKKKIKLFVMGNTPCFAPTRFLKQFPFVDGIFHNFMDKTIISALIGKPKLCPTCSTRSKIGTVNLKNQRIVDGINPPLYHLFPIAHYSSPTIKSKPFITAITAFGCPFTCSFCIASRLNYHTRDLTELEKEFKAMKKAGIKEIFFIDSTFNANPPFVDAVLRMMIKNKFRFSWSAQIHSFRVTPELIRLMKSAGCHTVQIGVESGNPQILKEYAPSKIKENITRAVQTCKEEGVRVLGYFIIGFPHESEKQALETIDYAKRLDPDFASFSTMTPDYGTKIYDEALKAHSFKDKETAPLSAFDSSGKSILHNAFLSPSEQDKLASKAYASFYLRPSKLLSFLKDIPRIGLYLKNGFFLIAKKIVK
ncbi:MAG: radical SAM protein [Microgenomates group bacterium]